MKIIAMMLIVIVLSAGIRLGMHLVAHIDRVEVVNFDDTNDPPRLADDKKE